MRQTNTCDFRKKWMAVLAKADWSSLNSAWKNNSIKPDYSYLRKAETGLVMVEGRMGGSGQPFNLGETTVTRCSVNLTSGEIGHAYIIGRNHEHAEISAICDALLQTDHNEAIIDNIIAPLEKIKSLRDEEQSCKAAATKVDFFTVVRGEDE